MTAPNESIFEIGDPSKLTEEQARNVSAGKHTDLLVSLALGAERGFTDAGIAILEVPDFTRPVFLNRDLPKDLRCSRSPRGAYWTRERFRRLPVDIEYLGVGELSGKPMAEFAPSDGTGRHWEIFSNTEHLANAQLILTLETAGFLEEVRTGE